MNIYKNIKDSNLASDFLFRQIIGALLVHWILLLALFLSILIPFVLLCIAPNLIYAIIPNSWYQLMVLTLSVATAILACHTLTVKIMKKRFGLQFLQLW